MFPDPDRLDLERDCRELIVFGFGPHHCVGSQLAKAELRCMLDAALDFLPPTAELREHEIQWSKTRPLFRRMETLPVDFGAAH